MTRSRELTWENFRATVFVKGQQRVHRVHDHPLIELFGDGVTNRIGIVLQLDREGPIPEALSKLAVIDATILCEHDDFFLKLATQVIPVQRQFYHFAIAVAERVVVEKRSAVEAVQLELQSFTELFQEKAILGVERQIGLIGELIFLERLIEIEGPRAIDSWLGPFGEPHDFRISTREFEVKTTVSPRRLHTIHGLEQLIPQLGCSLHLVSVLLGPPGAGDGFSLADKVATLSRQFEPELRQAGEFRSALESCGFRETDSAQYRRRFTMRRPIALVPVDHSFPAISREVVERALGPLASRVGSIQYDVDVDGLECEEGTEKFHGGDADSLSLADKNMSSSLERIQTALGAMGQSGPRSLIPYLEKPGPDFDTASGEELRGTLDMLLSIEPNGPARLLFSNLLRSWDNTKDAAWIAGTTRNTAQRRRRIHELLKSSPDLQKRIDNLLPYYHLDEPLIIAEGHLDWYRTQAGVRDYYWSEYVRYLGEHRDGESCSTESPSNHTRAIVECVADPESKVAYAARGLVMGYVQSGKTANFIGVAARAADAGYRLIIILAGTWNILRNQTQRRFDKELLGKELLRNDETYSLRPPPDWGEFLEHGAEPVELGQYTWQRLTRPDIDFQRLKAAIDNLEFEKSNKAAPIFDPSNLHALPVKLLVIKKHSGFLHNLVKDLGLIRTRLQDLPTLIIDDESDQAGLNTVRPKQNAPGEVERSKTNLRIVELLKLFPRGQYIGYTATPYANALVNSEDPVDLFPRDFILPLYRPQGYMGISDFFDPDTAYEDLQKDDYSQSEIAHIRRVESATGDDDADLKAALCSYVLAGGIKLYRLSSDPARYKAEHVRHIRCSSTHLSEKEKWPPSLGG